MSACVIFRYIYKEEQSLIWKFVLCCLTLYVCSYLLLAWALWDLKVFTDLGTAKEEMLWCRIWVFLLTYLSLNNPWCSVSIQTVSFFSSLSQNTSTWFSDGISVPREIKGYNKLLSRFQHHQPAWTNTAAFLYMCWKSTFEIVCNSANRWLPARHTNFTIN